MATMVITIPDNQLNRVVSALCIAYGRPADSPLTPVEFARRAIIDNIRSQVADIETGVLHDAAIVAVVPPPSVTLT